MAPGHVAVRRSTDFGRTWSKPEVIQPYIDWNLSASGLVYVPKPDRFVGLLCSAKGAGIGPKFQNAETSRWLLGERNGTAWSVTPKGTNKPERHSSGNSQGMGMRLTSGPHAGRLLISLRHFWTDERSEREQGNVVLFSDDDGATWQLGEPFARNAGSELGTAETSDGRLYGTMRNHEKGHWKTPRTVARSEDGGRTWIDVGPGGPFNTTWTNGDVERFPRAMLPQRGRYSP